MSNIGELIEQYQINVGYNNDLEKSIILIDYMDTIVYRSCTLNRLLKKWACFMGRKYSINSSFLYTYRKGVVASRMHNTISIHVIYKELAEQCVYYKLLDETRVNDFCKDAYNEEMDLERKFQSPKQKAIRFLKEEKKRGRKIFCVSDFRLASDDIMHIMKYYLIDGFFDGIFSSSEYGVTKKKGDFYQRVLHEINEEARDCIMIGDNFMSDCVNASRNGIVSSWIKSRNFGGSLL